MQNPPIAFRFPAESTRIHQARGTAVWLLPASPGFSGAQEAKLEGIRRTWSKMTVDFDGSREDCPLLADLSEAHRIHGSTEQVLSVQRELGHWRHHV